MEGEVAGGEGLDAGCWRRRRGGEERRGEGREVRRGEERRGEERESYKSSCVTCISTEMGVVLLKSHTVIPTPSSQFRHL